MNKNIILRYFIVFAGLALLIGCKPTRAHILTPQGDVINLEVAVTQEQKTTGLMYRQSLPEDSGMLFIMDKPQMASFWMKNTLIPLDALFLDESGTIVTIHTMVPCPKELERCPSYPAMGEVSYGLEINAGLAEELGLKVGDQLQINLP